MMASRDLAVVAGASGSIGAAIAGRLKDTMRVIATHNARPPGPADPNVLWVQFDAHDPESAQRLSETVASTGLRLSALFFCIGAPSSKQLIGETEAREFGDVYATNAAAFPATWQALRVQARAGSSSVVVLGSEASRTKRVGNAPYTAAKVALEAIVQTLAREEMDAGVRVNVVSPSLVASALAEEVLRRKGIRDFDAYYRALPWARALTPDEVAHVAVDVALGAQWRYATGQIFRLAVAHDD